MIVFISKYLIIFCGRIVISFLYILKFITGFNVSLLTPLRIGHLVGETDQFLRRQVLNNKFEKRIIITGNVCNKTIIKVISRYINIVQLPFLYRLLTYVVRKIPSQKIIKPLGMTLHEYTLYKKVKSVVSLSSSENERGFELIKKKYGIDKNDWWVCFHARDNAYFEKKHKQDMRYHDYRNCKISNMLPAMELIAQLGGYAIRYGDTCQEKLQVKNDRIIDYSFNGRSDFLDVFFVAKSKFFIGNTSGTSHIAKLFSIPYVMTNSIPFNLLPEQPNSIFIMKKIKDKNNNILTFNDCFKMGMFDSEKSIKFSSSSSYKKMNLFPLENSEEEIVGCVKDMIDMINKKNILKNTQIINKYYSQFNDRDFGGYLAPSFLTKNLNLF